MAVAAKGFRALGVYLEAIKIEHSIFALPFAMIGMMWGSTLHSGTAWPGWRIFLWICIAMVSCRSAAMAYNRIADRDIDARNPRTKMRAIPAGLLSLRHANLFFFASCAIFFFAASQLNVLALFLSPIALGVTLIYSQTKRFTAACHFVLGLSLGIAPAAAWIAVTGSVHVAAVALVGAVMCWTAGFDIIYSLQDVEFDKENGLHSLPAAIGRGRSLLISRISHLLAVLLLLLAADIVRSGVFAYIGVAAVAMLLTYEQSLVKPDDLRKVNVAFFTLNGFVSIGFLVFVLIDVLVRR